MTIEAHGSQTPPGQVGGMPPMAGATGLAALREQALKPAEFKRVNLETTVQEKAIAFPTDARLYDKARRALAAAGASIEFQAAAEL